MFRWVAPRDACVLGGSAMTTPALSTDEALLRDCLALDMLSRWTPRQIREWLADPTFPDEYREDMRRRLNQLREEYRNDE